MDGQVDSARKKQARELRREGLSLRDIAAHLSLSKTTVGRWLKGYSLGQEGWDRLKVRPQARDRVSHVKRTALPEGQNKTYVGQRDSRCSTGQSRKTLPGWMCLLLIVGALGFFLFQMWLKKADKAKSQLEVETGDSEGRPFDNLAS